MSDRIAGRRPDPTAWPEWLLLTVALWHLLFWGGVPPLTYAMLPLDTLELLGWGQEWQAGYYKHPPLGAWLGELWLHAFGGWLGSLYLLSQACVLVTYGYVWLTARRFLDRDRAVIATVVLAAAYWFSVLTPNFNMNVLQLPLWAGFCYHFIRAVENDAWHWLAVGAFAALALLAKYSGLLLIASAGAALLLPRYRSHWRQPLLYLGAALALLLLSPHLLWLNAHAELPLRYLRSFDAAEAGTAASHLIEPLRFAIGALLGCALSVLLLALLRSPQAKDPARTPHRLLILLLCFGPLVLAMGYGLISGSRLKSTWAFPFFNLLGVALLLSIRTSVDHRAWRRFVVGLGVMLALTATAHLAYKLRSDRSKTAFEGAQLATLVEQRWQARFRNAPLRIVVGDHIVSAIVSSYAKDRPSMLVNADFSISLWLRSDDLGRSGAAVVCRASNECFPTLRADNGAIRVDDVLVDAERFEVYLIAPGRAENSTPTRADAAQSGAG